jgi:hypothetical protein
MLFDVMAALVIVGTLALALAAVLGRHHRAAQKLADTRAAALVAEAVLADLQAGKPAPAGATPADPDVTVRVRPAAGAGADSKMTWVEVVVAVRAGRASLVGAVPRGVTP